jgi:hypothetical protein
LADAQLLPHGRCQAGDRHFKFYETRDNLSGPVHAVAGRHPANGGTDLSLPARSPEEIRVNRSTRVVGLLAATALVLTGCGGADEEETASPAAEPSAATAGGDCSPGSLETLEEGTLTVGTDSPAFEPWFSDDDPTNGKGFESAVAYAVASSSATRRTT